MRYLMPILLAAGMAMGQAAGEAPRDASGPPTPAKAAAGGQSVALDFAGVKLVVPAGYVVETTPDPVVALRALKVKDNAVEATLTVLAAVEPAETTLDQFVAKLKPPVSKVLLNVEVVKSMDWPVGTLPGKVQILKYDFRTVPTTAIRLYFLRPVPAMNAQMAYMLVVEAERRLGKEAMDAFGAVVRTVELFDPVRPGDALVKEFWPPIVSQRLGYSLRVPMHWKVDVSPDKAGVTFFQANYAVRSQARQGTLAVRPENALGAKEVAAKARASLLDKVRGPGRQPETVEEGPAKIAGAEGYQFILRDTVPAEGGGKIIYTIAIRSVCQNGQAYTLTLLWGAEDPAIVKAAMDVLSEAMELSKPESILAPTTGPGPTTAPAPTPAPEPAPTTKPAPLPAPPVAPEPAPTTKPAPLPAPPVAPVPAPEPAPPAKPAVLPVPPVAPVTTPPAAETKPTTQPATKPSAGDVKELENILIPRYEE